MEGLVNKISSYHIFNNLVPGILFLLMCSNEYSNILEKSVINLLFISYFIGIVIGRISSLLIEKLIMQIFSIKKEKYEDYIIAAEKDKKIEVLMQDMNMYRNLCTLATIILVIKIIRLFNLQDIITSDLTMIVIFMFLIILFAYSYNKQVKYVTTRIKNINKQ